MRDLPCRQVHLDFHTSPDIPDVGVDFDADRFADRLQRAHVQSVTLFARCHHGHLYYPSTKFPERVHPHLQVPDLLRQQMEACHARGIRTPVYTTVQWDQFTADQHRDWLVVDEAGCLPTTPPLEPGFYRFLDVLHPGYRAFLAEHVAELLEMFPLDGLFFDIVQPKASLTPHWVRAMDQAGVDPADEASRRRFAGQVIDDWKREMTDTIRQHPGYDPQRCTIFYNSGHIGPRHRSSRDCYTHYEIESLPSGGWGYLHFPLAMRYAAGLGKPCLGMTGKFHSTWGDFHSLKNQAALEFECFHALALGAACSIGDQLHPFGELDEATYQLIGRVYQQVEAKQPWCDHARPAPEIGVLTAEEFVETRSKFAATSERQPESMMGAVRMLQELGRQFDILSSDRDLSPYRLIILPDEIVVDDALRQKLEAYLDAGGRLIASHASGLDPAAEAFALPSLGVSFRGLAEHCPNFVLPGKSLQAGLEPAAYVMYLPALHVEPAAPDTQVLANTQQPFFNRTWRHFCSHAHAPAAPAAGPPAVLQHHSSIYFAHPIFRQYQNNAPRWCRQLLANAIDRLIGPALVHTDGPSTLINVLSHQPDARRHLLHLLHYIPERRGQAFDIVEDLIPLHDLKISVALPDCPTTVRQVPDDRKLNFDWHDGRAHFTLDRLEGHTILELPEP